MEQQLWNKVVLTVNTTEASLIDLASNLFFELGSIGVEVNYAPGYLDNHPNLFGEIRDELIQSQLNHDTEIIAFFEDEVDLADIKAELAMIFGELPFQLEQGQQEDEQWQTNWMAHYQPQTISRFLTIVPEWYENYQARADERVVYLDPGVAFGTGNHPTTKLGAQALEMVLRGGETVLDVGTGSGILAFVAKQLGAEHIYGYDLDPQAIDSAKQNLLLQPEQSNIEFSVNDLLVGITHQADVIVANILPHILVNLFDDAAKLLKPNGWLILGGILEEKSSELESELAKRGWQLEQKTIMHEWVSLLLKKSEA
ncbi:50S ribosomal protein L11 methyltransferase [Aerococcaceae bacterium zg-ZJ1578]|uniref:50S ribosomal protein L11 methyltransferase n=1 Tax=Aerococcaceae bacterium zg-252 TaxID=2796928 RepID=UPI001A30C111|nr:50S ribosomal protein L11 methyltransferase [Aerococcaceae bacterium zg-1578]